MAYFWSRAVAAIAGTVLVLVISSTFSQEGKNLENLADQYVDLRLQYDPTLALALGIPTSAAMHLPDRTPAAIVHLHSQEDELLAEVKAAIDSERRSIDPTTSVLLEELESRKGLRVCRPELWDLSQTEGWQVELPNLAVTLPVETPDDRESVLQLWKTLPQYLQTDKENLTNGLAQGYSVPKSVVRRVLRQLDALATTSPEDSPFYEPAKRIPSSPEFAVVLHQQVVERIIPSIREYAEFLRKVYLPQARESLGITDLPNGLSCYEAYLRRYTTTADTPKFVFAAGQEVVEDSNKEIQSIGSHLYHTKNIPAIIASSNKDPKNRFKSSAELREFTERVVHDAERMSKSLFLNLPTQSVVVEPLPEYQIGSGVGSHYAANPDDRQSAIFWIDTEHWASETRGAAEITAVHETVPGHHLQIGTGRRLPPASKLAKLVFNAAYTEGWANYAERLAEEQGIDNDDYERIQRRILAGRSLVIDPGIHAFGWSRQRAEAFAMETGMTKEQADDVIDRIVVEPGQLTSYEIGGLEILSLRESSKRKMGVNFDLRRFHQCVLEDGPVPLKILRAKTERCLTTMAHASN